MRTASSVLDGAHRAALSIRTISMSPVLRSIIPTHLPEHLLLSGFFTPIANMATSSLPQLAQTYFTGMVLSFIRASF
jgi:hypothetical protein